MNSPFILQKTRGKGEDYGTGLRLGELLALEWNKVDLERRTIKIERTQTEYTDYDSNSKIYEENPDTASKAAPGLSF